MAHGVHPAVTEVQTPHLDPVLDRVVVQPGPEELVAVDHPVLRSCDPRDLEIDGCGRLRGTVPLK
jgi:hypothetical protein